MTPATEVTKRRGEGGAGDVEHAQPEREQDRREDRAAADAVHAADYADGEREPHEQGRSDETARQRPRRRPGAGGRRIGWRATPQADARTDRDDDQERPLGPRAARRGWRRRRSTPGSVPSDERRRAGRARSAPARQ